MSLIEGDAYFPLFSTAEIPIDFSAAPLVPDSPGKFAPQFQARRPSFALSNSQTVPGHGNISVQNLGPLDEPLFSLFMNGAEKMDLNSGFVKGLQIPEELLLQSSVVPDVRKLDGMMMGMDQRQFVQMGLLPPDAMVNGDFNMVPQIPKTAPTVAEENAANAKGSNSRKRKFIPTPVKCEAGQVPTPGGEGQPLTPEEERNMKRQRRLVKNREAAQLFRQRQKAYIQDLEKKVADLSATNNEFRARVELLNSENKLIKEQLLYLRNFITQAVSFSFPKSPNSEDGSSSSPGSLLGPLPAGLTLPPEILGAMGNPNMALGLMGALGPIPGLPGVPNFAEALAALPSQQVPSSAPSSAPSTPARSPQSSPSQPNTPPNTPVSSSSSTHTNPLIPPHMETHPIKLPGITPAKTSPLPPSGTVNISAISPVAVPSSIPIVPSLSTVVTAAAAQTVASPVAVPVPSASLIPPPTRPLNTSQNGANAVVPDMGSHHVVVPEHLEVKVKIEK